MSTEYTVEQKTPGWLIGVSVGGLVLALASLGWAFGLQNHLKAAEDSLDNANKQNAALAEKIEDTN